VHYPSRRRSVTAPSIVVGARYFANSVNWMLQ
jgi:hypothetical protein